MPLIKDLDKIHNLVGRLLNDEDWFFEANDYEGNTTLALTYKHWIQKHGLKQGVNIIEETQLTKYKETQHAQDSDS